MSNEDTLNNFDKSIVKIITNEGRNNGTGFIVTDDGIICTCFHCISNNESNEVSEDIHVYFPNTGQTSLASILIEDKNEGKEKCVDPIEDIAFLQLSKKDQIELKNKGESLLPLPLSKFVKLGHDFLSKGFTSRNDYPVGLGSNGKIISQFQHTVSYKDIVERVQLKADNIEKGMSGCPILDIETGKIIGMVDRTHYSIDPSLVMAIPVKSITKLYPKLRKKNPGLGPSAGLIKYLRYISKIENLFNTSNSNGYDQIKESKLINEYYVENFTIPMNIKRQWYLIDEKIPRHTKK